MCYLLGGLFHQKKFFPVKFIDPNLFPPWLLVFSYLIDTFVLIFFHVIYITYVHSLYVVLFECFFFYYFLAALPLLPFSTVTLFV